jgi:hypothetical protein
LWTWPNCYHVTTSSDLWKSGKWSRTWPTVMQGWALLLALWLWHCKMRTRWETQSLSGKVLWNSEGRGGGYVRENDLNLSMVSYWNVGLNLLWTDTLFSSQYQSHWANLWSLSFVSW